MGRQMVELLIWGRRPPPVGGVTRCVQAIAQAMGRRGVSFQLVDPGAGSDVLRALFVKTRMQLFNVSSVRRLPLAMALSLLRVGKSVTYFHSGTIHVQLESRWMRWVARYCFRRFDELW